MAESEHDPLQAESIPVAGKAEADGKIENRIPRMSIEELIDFLGKPNPSYVLDIFEGHHSAQA